MTEAERNSLVERYLPLVKRTAYGLIRAYGMPAFIDAEDAIQEASLSLLTAVDRFEGRNGACLDTFLHKVIRHDILDAIDKQWRRDRFNLQTEVAVEPKHRHMEIDRTRVNKLLTAKQFRVYELFYVYGFTQQSIADKLGREQPNVARMIARAKNRLKILS